MKDIILKLKNGKTLEAFTDGVDVWVKDRPKMINETEENYKRIMPKGKLLEKAVFAGIAKDMILNMIGITANVKEISITIKN